MAFDFFACVFVCLAVFLCLLLCLAAFLCIRVFCVFVCAWVCVLGVRFSDLWAFEYLVFAVFCVCMYLVFLRILICV